MVPEDCNIWLWACCRHNRSLECLDVLQRPLGSFGIHPCFCNHFCLSSLCRLEKKASNAADVIQSHPLSSSSSSLTTNLFPTSLLRARYLLSLMPVTRSLFCQLVGVDKILPMASSSCIENLSRPWPLMKPTKSLKRKTFTVSVLKFDTPRKFKNTTTP